MNGNGTEGKPDGSGILTEQLTDFPGSFAEAYGTWCRWPGAHCPVEIEGYAELDAYFRSLAPYKQPLPKETAFVAWLRYADMKDRKQFVKDAHHLATLALYGTDFWEVARRAGGTGKVATQAYG